MIRLLDVIKIYIKNKMESRDRNWVLQKIYNFKLPSYSIWTEESIYEQSYPVKKKWWKEIDKVRKDNNIDDEEVKEVIKKWIDIFTLPNEYCSKRTGASDI